MDDGTQLRTALPQAVAAIAVIVRGMTQKTNKIRSNDFLSGWSSQPYLNYTLSRWNTPIDDAQL